MTKEEAILEERADETDLCKREQLIKYMIDEFCEIERVLVDESNS